MANLFTRIKESVSADFHDLLDQKEQKNPMALLNQYLRQSEQETEKVRKLVERQHRLKEEFTRELHKAEDLANKRKHQAEIANKAGEDAMYEFAMKEYEEYASRADRMKASREDAVNQLEELEQKYEEMKHKLKDMHLRRLELMGKENVARAHHRMNSVIERTSHDSYSRFSEMEHYIDDLEYKVNSAYYRNTFDSKIAQLEKQMQEQEKAEANH
ncbi:PspA/IM30 family protein [Thalassobacillus pellis]|uniref:PspA/IM30 family protein n=1 Tax=Thalassobacillus pellis TaxID=748008 RepID=UPI001960210C|nr:PspA/IM30 family protein [Thalassobacillus pellis]MBM7551925.1 phage shock protein A [Thalassobacillus pellis]